MLPYLRLKRRQAEIALEMLERSKNSNNGLSLSEQELNEREGLRQESQMLNAKRRPEDRLEWVH